MTGKLLFSTLASLEISAEWEDAFLWYFGNDYATFDSTLTRHKHGKAMPVGQIITDLARRYRHDFVNLDQKLVAERWQWLWATTDLGERNPLISSFVSECCRCIAMLGACRDTKNHIFVTDTAEEADLYYRVARANGIAALTNYGTSRIRWALRHWRNRLFSLARTFTNATRGRIACRRILSRRREELRGRAFDVLLVTWATSNDVAALAANGPDLMLGDLPAHMDRHGIKMLRLVNPMFWLDSTESIANACTEAESAMLMPQMLWSWCDLLRSCLWPQIIPFIISRRLCIDGHDLSPLVSKAIKRELVSGRSTSALLYSGIGIALAELNITIGTLLLPYENQPWEKMLMMGMRVAQPDIRCVAIQSSPSAFNYLCSFPSLREVASGMLLPDTLSCCGNRARNWFVAESYPITRLITGGSPRYAHLLDQITTPGTAEAGRLRLLIAGTLKLANVFELIKTVGLAVQDIAGITVQICLHPRMPKSERQILAQELSPLLNSISAEWSDQPALASLPQCDVVITCGSGIAFEAIAIGRPVLEIASAIEIDLDKLMVEEVQILSVASLRAHLIELCDHPATRTHLLEASQQALCDTISPVDYDALIGTLHRLTPVAH